MKMVGEEVHLYTDEARAGEETHVVRYVLAFSLTLAIIALSAIWIAGALSQKPGQGQAVTAEEHALGG